MQIKLLLFVVLATFSFSSLAAAGPLAWNCELNTTNVTGFSFAIGPSISLARGRGNVHCISVDGAHQEITPVRVNLLGGGVGIGYTDIKELEIRIIASGLSSPTDMYGILKFETNVSVAALHSDTNFGNYLAINKFGTSVDVEIGHYSGYGFEAKAEVQGVSITPID